MERLQKLLAEAGIASRRKAEQMIVQGRVRVNGRVVSELGTRVDPQRDRVQVDGEDVRVEKKTYVVLHKPRGYLSDRDVPGEAGAQGRSKPTALDLVPVHARLYAAGRLDANSEGLLLLTNDGRLAHRVTHPSFEHSKEYLALVEGMPDEKAVQRLQAGVWYEGERLRVDSVRIVRHLGEAARPHHWPEARAGESWLRLTLHEGKKREIRHLCGAVGHPVKRLIRVRIGPIELGKLAEGQWRTLSEREVRELVTAASRKR